jgi:hypothetical protein
MINHPASSIFVSSIFLSLIKGIMSVIVNHTNSKFHRPLAIIIAALLGGPLSAGWLIAENFKSLKVIPLYIFTILITGMQALLSGYLCNVFLHTNLYQLKLLYVVMNLGAAALAAIIFFCFQQAKIKAATGSKTIYYGTERAMIIGVAGGIICYIVFFSLIVAHNISMYKAMH